MTKIASAIQVMRDAHATAWTAARDSAMVAWSNAYLAWLLTNPLSIAEKESTNNHGTFWFAHAASVQVIVGDTAGANTTLHEYFDGIYLNQINGTGDQPLEAARTLPFHYRAYNIGGILVSLLLTMWLRLLCLKSPILFPRSFHSVHQSYR